jgi:1,4-alpha-glucan branching enzyme
MSLSTTSYATALIAYKEHNPHHFLGLHSTPQGQRIRLWRPGATSAHFEVLGQIVEAAQVDSAGLFEFSCPKPISRSDYRIFHSDGTLQFDPYAMGPLIGELDAYLFNAGCHYEPYRMLGAHLREMEGIAGVHFALWAPNARSVYLVFDMNHWNGQMHPMRSMGGSGIWELFIPGAKEGMRYKFEIRKRNGEFVIKSDPYAFWSELRPKNSSVVFDIERYQWQDPEWMAKRGGKDIPLNIYEVHLGSWKKNGVEFPNFRVLALELAIYCNEMGFTHVELMPVMEHPLDESWGYQVSGFYAVTSRYGTPEDFQFFVDTLHRAHIGVILDWVPAHFPTDDFGLHLFDGTALYEHEDLARQIHPHWNTAIFNYGRKEVSNFLLGNALFWFDKMHVDGLRVDAVASMLYLDYGRNLGEWIPNSDGGNLNLDAIEFIKHLNSIVHQKFPSVMMIAEESSSFSGVTHPVSKGGLGFDLKWNMGWMNDTLRYFTKDPIYRCYHQNDLTFSLLYAFTERFLLVLSHDEVVHLKGSLLSKMPGPDWQKFAGVRLLYSYQIGHPGKKLLFMGGEIGQWNEWDCKGELPWHVLQYPLHLGLFTCVKELNHLYLKSAALWSSDFDWQGYEWIDFSDHVNCVISYVRKGGGKSLVFVHHFSPEYLENYWVNYGGAKNVREILTTDDVRYGGSGKCNRQIKIADHGFCIALAPLATMIFEIDR